MKTEIVEVDLRKWADPQNLFQGKSYIAPEVAAAIENHIKKHGGAIHGEIKIVPKSNQIVKEFVIHRN